MESHSVIAVAPSALRLKVGEIKQVQVITEYDKFTVSMQPNGIVEWDEIHREFKGITRGYALITFNAYSTIDGVETLIGSDYMSIDVSTETLKSPVRYMWHNRATNRLVTVQADRNENDDLTFKLPKKSGTLLTDTTSEIISGNIATPMITHPTTDVTEYDGIIRADNFKLRINMPNETHTGTTWQYSLTEDFGNIIKEEYIPAIANNTITSTTASFYGITTYARVKYHSNIGESLYSSPIKISWASDSPEVNNNSLLAGDTTTGAYYGSVDETTYLDNRDYRGNYVTLMNNGIRAFNQGAQVTVDNVLYYTNQALDATTSLLSPGTTEGSAYWEVDNRENLPTVRWLMDRVGIGLGYKDNNLDTFSSDGVSVGAQINTTSNPWLKFIVNGKLFYTTAKVVCDTISWNDVAKRNAVYGNRTIRIGTRLYKVRLLTEEEYKACFINLVAINTDLAGKTSAVDKNLIEDFREGSKRYVISSTGVVSDVTAGTRTCAYRPVLELIREGDEPYNKIPNCALAKDENFRYDKYTDTGYFGFVEDSNNELITNEELMLVMGYTNGTKLTTGLGYYKFYFHGIVYYMVTKPLRVGGTTLFLEKLNLTYMADMGLGNKLTVVKNDVVYTPSAMQGIRFTPWSGAVSLTNVQEDSQASLLWRIVKTFVNTNSGIQVGDNWEELDPATFITNVNQEYLYQEIGIFDGCDQTKVINNGTLYIQNLNVDNGIGNDCYPLILSVKTYNTL